MKELSNNTTVYQVRMASEEEFQHEEAELHAWLNKNISDPVIRKEHLERLKADHVARGSFFA